MKTLGVICIVVGIIAAIFVYGYDVMIKQESHITLGPRSGPALGVSILILIVGIILANVRPPKKE